MKAGRVTPCAPFEGKRSLRRRAEDFPPYLPLRAVRHRLPKLHLSPCPLFSARAIGSETGRDDKCLAEAMVEHDQAVVKTHMAVRQFEIVDGAARKFRLGEIFQVVTPVTEAAAQWKRPVNFIQQLAARQQRVQNLPRIAELELGSGSGSGVWRFRSASRRSGR